MDKKGDTNFFTSQMIKTCMKKVITVNLHQTIQVCGALELVNVNLLMWTLEDTYVIMICPKVSIST